MVEGVEITGPLLDRFDEILTPEALGFVAALQREFDPRRRELLAARRARQAELSAGARSTSFPGPPTSARPNGGSPRPPPDWRTAGSRSPGRSTAR